MKVIRSPFFYVGDKYKLMSQLVKLFPLNINRYIDPFVGGGSSFLNIDAKSFILNDKNEYIINLHNYFQEFRNFPDNLLNNLLSIINYYGLSCSFISDIVPAEMKAKYIKTYYAVFNKDAYKKMRQDFNSNGKSDMSLLYLLLIYGFNHMIRFNLSGEFNLPVGNVDFNSNVVKALINYLEFSKNRNINFHNSDYSKFLSSISYKKTDFVYLDPPYLIGYSEYNKMWSLQDENQLYEFLDDLDLKGVKFGLSNLVEHKGKENKILRNWMVKYNIYTIKSNYISRFDNSIKNSSQEVFITNYAEA